MKLLDAPGWSAAIPIDVMLGSAPTTCRNETSVVLGSRSDSSTPHLEAHRVREEIGHRLRFVGDHLTEDACLMERAAHRPPGLHQRAV